MHSESHSSLDLLYIGEMLDYSCQIYTVITIIDVTLLVHCSYAIRHLIHVVDTLFTYETLHACPLIFEMGVESGRSLISEALCPWW
jgi:hypothetical protein